MKRSADGSRDFKRNRSMRDLGAIRLFFHCVFLLIVLPFATAAGASDPVKMADDQGYPPYIFLNASGQPDGLEVDLFRLIEQDTGIKFEWTLTEFGKAVAMLKDGQVALIPGMNVTEERRREFIFSRPYLQDKGVLFVPADSYHINRLGDLTGRRVGVQQGEVAEQYLLRSGASFNLYLFPSQQLLLQAVAERKIDAAVCNYYSGFYFLYQLQLEEKVKAIGEPLYSHPFAVAAAANNAELLGRIDATLDNLQASGKIEALQEKWFGRQTLIFGLTRQKIQLYGEMAAGIIVLAACAIFILIRLLRRKIAEATREIAGQRDELNRAYQELAAQNEELLAQDEMLSFQNKVLQRQEASLVERTRALEALQETTLEVIQLDESEELFARILIRAAQTIGASHGVVDTWDAAKSKFSNRAALGAGLTTRFTPGRGLSNAVVQAQKTIILENYQDWDQRDLSEDLNVLRAVAGAPIFIHGEVRGTMCLGFDDEAKRFSAEQAAVMEQFVRMVAIVLERTDQNEALRDSEARYRSAIDATDDAIFDWNLATGEVCGSAKWEDRLGFTFADIDIRRFELAIHPEDRANRAEALAKHLSGDATYYTSEYRLKTINGDYFWVRSKGRAIRDEQGVPIRIVGAMTEITDSKLREEKIRALAYTDSLTGLPNRRAFLEKLDGILAQNSLEQAQGAVVFLDIDDFKVLNDSMGHACGDILLIELGKRLVDIVGSNQMVARLGGDEFVFILQDRTDREDMERFIQTVLTGVTQPFEISGQQVFCMVSIGVARYPDDGIKTDELFRDADIALHAAKRNGKNMGMFFNSALRNSVYRRMRMDLGLRQAIKNDELYLAYQPIIAVPNGKIAGFEALLRWDSPEFGSVSPVEFIPVAEETGRIIEIGKWTMEKACHFIQDLFSLGYSDLFISVNISARQVSQADFVETVTEVLQKTGLNPNLMELEITESILMESMERNMEKLHRLKDLGVKLALDDFGTGYSSLTYLRDLPIDKVKIDKSFVHAVEENAEKWAILESIIQLAHTLGLSVVAEGVETETQRSKISSQACDFLQGFLFGKPVNAEKIVQLIHERAHG